MKHAIAAIAATALLAAVPARAAEPRESASHETKLTCVIYNALLVSIYDGDGEDDPTRKAAQENGERWSEVLLVDAGGDEAKVMTEVNQRLDAVSGRAGAGAREEEQMTFLIQKLEAMQKVCEPYDT